MTVFFVFFFFSWQIQSGLGKLILKEEMERELNREKHSYTTPRYNQQFTNCTGTGTFSLTWVGGWRDGWMGVVEGA